MSSPKSSPEFCSVAVPAPVKLQSGVRFRAHPSELLKKTFAQWIGCQRVIYNAKVCEDRLFASQRRLDMAHYPSSPLPTPLDRCYSQFKDKILTPWLYEVPSQILRNGADRWWEGKSRQLKGLARAPVMRNKANFDSVVISSELFRFTDIPDAVTGKTQRYLVIGTVADVVDILAFDAHCAYGEPKQLVVRRTGKHWWLSFSYEHDAPAGYLERSDEELAYELRGLSEAQLRVGTLGVDRNVRDNYIATNDGRFFQTSALQQERMARKDIGRKKHQRRLTRQVRGSVNRAKTLARMATKNEYKNNVTRDFSHQTSHALVGDSANGGHAPVLIGLEALKVMNLVKRPRAVLDPKTGKWLANGRNAKSALTRRILAACWGLIKTQVQYKAKRRNCLVVAVRPHFTSQKCSRCGHTHPDNRHEARFICQRCGHQAHADTNAAVNIRALAVDAVRDDKVVNKAVKRVAFRKRKISGRESSGVPVESSKTQTEGLATGSCATQCSRKQEDAPTTACSA